MKMKRFDGGGYTGDDPIVKYRMGMIDAKGNDLTKKVEPKAVSKVETESKQGEHPMIDADTRARALAANAPKFISKGYSGNSINPDRLARKDILNQFPETKKRFDAVSTGYMNNPKFTDKDFKEFEAYENAGYKSGGKVKSASSRADGCAIRGKTRA